MRSLPLILALALPLAARALVVEGYEPEVNDRFASGYSDAPVPNTSARFVGKDYDWSGVGWLVGESEKSFAMITPRHFLFSQHWAPKPGDTLRFLNRAGELKSYVVERLDDVPLGRGHSDLGVGRLSAPIPVADQIAHYGLLFLGPTISKYVGQPLLLYGHTARIGKNSIVDGLLIAGLSADVTYEGSALGPGMAKCESGDSGSPTFIPHDGKLTLVGIHHTPDTDSMLAGLIEPINRLLAPDGYKLKVQGK